jgi:hypothetical protein
MATRSNPHWRRHQYILSMQDNWVRGVSGRRPAMNYEVYANDYGGFNPDFGPAEMNDFFLTSLAGPSRDGWPSSTTRRPTC